MSKFFAISRAYWIIIFCILLALGSVGFFVYTLRSLYKVFSAKIEPAAVATSPSPALSPPDFFGASVPSLNASGKNASGGASITPRAAQLRALLRRYGVSDETLEKLSDEKLLQLYNDFQQEAVKSSPK